MLILLDTTVFGADPLCSSNAWRVITHARTEWGLKIFVSEVVLIEAIAGYQRRILEQDAALAGFEDKKLSNLGLRGHLNEARKGLDDAAADYPERLKGVLSDIGVSVLPIPDIPHEDLVRRAASRQRPCDDDGDGYRDTLNWFSLLQLLRNHEDDLIWVSRNSRDFAIEGSPADGMLELHPNLEVELDSSGYAGRVKYASSLNDTVSFLANEIAPELPQELRDLREHLQAKTLKEFIDRLLVESLPSSADPRRCALPLETKSADVVGVAEGASDPVVEIQGSAGSEKAIANFTITCPSALLVVLPPDHPDFPNAVPWPDGTAATIREEKELVYSGYVTLNSLGHPQGGELVSIEAVDDDPGKTLWINFDKARRRAAAQYKISKAMPGFDPNLFAKLYPDLPSFSVLAGLPNLTDAIMQSYNAKFGIDFSQLESKYSFGFEMPNYTSAFEMPKYDFGIGKMLDNLVPKYDFLAQMKGLPKGSAKSGDDDRSDAGDADASDEGRQDGDGDESDTDDPDNLDQ